jgi:GDP-4-dehydro-6-deoxy-D-mannose reductase
VVTKDKEESKAMRFLVTGATAFAGSHLAQLLIREGHEVWCTSRRTNGSEAEVLDLLSPEEYEKINWVFCDLLNENSCRMAFLDITGKSGHLDGVFHLAAQSHPPTGFKIPFYTQDINVVGTLSLLKAMLDFMPRTRFMFCSTSEVYGAPDLQDGQKIAEEWPITTVNPYASSKAMIDIFLQERIRNGFVDGFITRAFSHTGPRRGKIFSISSDAYQIAKILGGHQEHTIRVGNLSSRRAVMDVRDCVWAYYQLMQSGHQGVFNVGADNCFTIGELLERMLQLSGLSGRVTLKVDDKLWRPIDIPVQIPDTAKLKNSIPWSCAIPIDQTLSDLLQYWEKKLV